ncbi:MAG: glycoside hydrolase family 3 N-terminal domain-containing protein, partial [Microbacteriaceae bacterium]
QIVQHADAFRAGMSASGVISVVKHFPGMGAVTENTDTSSGVTDTTTTADGAAVGVFRSEIEAGARCVMVSSAIYTNLDPGVPAVFSPVITGTLLRQTLGFTGVVMTDDVSAATQVEGWSPADRAVLAIQAGADIVLDSADPSLAPEMVQAVATKAATDPAFAALVDAAARRVVTMKLTR